MAKPYCKIFVKYGKNSCRSFSAPVSAKKVIFGRLEDTIGTIENIIFDLGDKNLSEY